MKKLIFLSLLLIPSNLLAQSADSLYIVTYTTGPAWDTGKPAHEQRYFKEHSANLGQWRKEGIIKLGARYGDKGMIVVAATTLAAAKVLIANEESVANNLFKADVQKFNVF